jgi:hypothetical protein
MIVNIYLFIFFKKKNLKILFKIFMQSLILYINYDIVIHFEKILMINKFIYFFPFFLYPQKIPRHTQTLCVLRNNFGFNF